MTDPLPSILNEENIHFMKAMILEKQASIEPDPLKFSNIERKNPTKDEVEIEVSYCAICRTDLHVIEGDLPPNKMPVIPGHQILGVVSRLGSACQRFTVGQRIGAAWLRKTCGQCEFCKRGKENLCDNPEFTGYSADGGYAQYVRIPEAFAYEIADNLSDLQAVPLLCSGIIGYRALKRSCLPPGGDIALFGFGSSAHLVAQIVKYQKSRFYVVSRNEHHRDLAKTLGAQWVGNSVEGFPLKVDSAIIFAPAGNLVPQALSILKKGGTVSLAGIHMSDIPSLNYEKHLFYEKNIHSVTANTRSDGIELFKLASKISFEPRTKIYPLEEANQALQDLKQDRINGTGILKVS